MDAPLADIVPMVKERDYRGGQTVRVQGGSTEDAAPNDGPVVHERISVVGAPNSIGRRKCSVIIINRETGEAVYPSLPEETRKKMRAAILGAYLKEHPEEAQKAARKYEAEIGMSV